MIQSNKKSGLLNITVRSLRRGAKVLTEKEMMQSWGRLFRNCEYSELLFQKAEMLLEEIKPESPLRHRLANELDELRSRFADRAVAAK